mmetsp:Transcript_288/g.557  ORF Transcript_288/g.557 Transcript_288/m.557 type:complete len:108 (-) Transcript_288:13-336(-)
MGTCWIDCERTDGRLVALRGVCLPTHQALLDANGIPLGTGSTMRTNAGQRSMENKGWHLDSCNFLHTLMGLGVCISQGKNSDIGGIVNNLKERRGGGEKEYLDPLLP